MSSLARKTVNGTASGEIVEKKSRFICTLTHVESEAEAEAVLAAQKKKYYDARHHCSAFILGNDPEIVRSNDDGEPAGSAGRPILSVLQGEELHDTIAVVTRYFGGTLLGVGGLIRAYSGAVKEALNNASFLEKKMGIPVDVTCTYNDDGKLKYRCREQGLIVLNEVYSDNVTTTLLLEPSDADRTLAEIVDLTGGRAVIDKKDTVSYNDIDGKIEVTG
ncbi:MAG: YigZ family protein [Lachnospiraceae bacterium]|nr:YigZ family protein [Candidatus Equihabitans merdae]